MNQEYIPELNPETVWRVLDDGAIVVTPKAGNVRVLNQVGTAIWQLIDGENSLADIESRLVRDYDVPLECVRRDLYTFVEELERRNMITWKNARPGANEAMRE